jgi:hypothetical protein
MASIISSGTTSGTALNMTADTSGQLQLATGASATTAVTIDTSQNVGIGTSSPSTKLHVYNAGDVTTTIGSNTGASILNLTSNSNSSGAYNAIISNTASGENWYIGGLGNSNSLSFRTNGGNERMRISSTGQVTVSGGNILLGSPSVSGVLGLYEGTTGYTTYLLGVGTRAYQLKGSSGGDYSLSLYNDGGGTYQLLVGYTTSNGAYRLQVNSQIFATSSTIATSDARYKTNVEPISSALNLVTQLNPVQFDWKKHPIHDFPEGKTIGFLAQEVGEVLKDTDYVNNVVKTNECTITPEEKDEKGNITKEAVKEEFLGIAEGNLIPLLTKAIQEQQTIINDLKARIETLEAK